MLYHAPFNQLTSTHPLRRLAKSDLFLIMSLLLTSACQKMILVVGLYDESGYLGADLIILGGFGQDLACIWGSDRIGVV